MANKKLLLTFYGDDFTGSTDAMEGLTLGGVRTALFLSPPTPEQLTGRFSNLQAVGVAGTSRSMTPGNMEAELRPKFEELKALGAPICHYKICSTFDSSAQVGCIGRAIDVGCDVFKPKFVPLLVGAPTLKRYVAFGNLFATVGAETFRLDRHPTMSKHPITPMCESDLRLHLSQQTDKSIALFDLLHLAAPSKVQNNLLETLLNNEAEIILFDTLNDEHLLKTGRLIWKHRGDTPLFVVGSSGVEYALTAYWQKINKVPRPEPFSEPGVVDRLIVMSGSASPVTASQIGWAVEHGFFGIRINTTKLIDPTMSDVERKRTIQKALTILDKGQSIVMYSVQGPEDPAITATTQHMKRLGLSPNSVGQILGKQQGQILRTLLEKTGIRRACVAGGDTSGHTALQLGIYALEMALPIAPGAPLCRASSHQSNFDGLEISLKGGQNGQPNYFGQIQQGRV